MTAAFDSHIENKKGLKPIVIITIDGIGYIDALGNDVKYKFCSRIPKYAQDRQKYLPLLATYPDLLSTETPPLGGIQTPGQVSFKLIDKKTSDWPHGIISTLFNEEQSPMAFLKQNIGTTATSIRMTNRPMALGALPRFFWMGGECLRMTYAFPFADTVFVQRAQLGTKAAAHKERTPAFEYNNLALGRGIQVSLGFDDLTEVDEQELEGGYFIREYRVDDGLLTYEIKATSRQEWFQRPIATAQQVGTQTNNGDLADRNRWFISREKQTPQDWLLSGLDRYGRLFARVEASGEIVNFTWQDQDTWRGADSRRQVWNTPRTTPDEWVGTKMKTCLLADKDLENCSFVYQPPGAESDLLNSTSWIPSDHPLIILLCLLTSSAEYLDGLWKNNYIPEHGHFACLAPGWGIGIRADLIDFLSFWKAISTTANLRVSRLIIEEPEPFKDFAEAHLLRPFGFVLGWTNGKISVQKPGVFSTYFSQDHGDFDETNILLSPERTADVSLSRDTSTLAGEVIFTNTSFDGSTNTITFRDADFQNLFGYTTAPDITKKKLAVETKGIQFAGGGDNYFLETRAAELLYYYARPVWRLAWRTGLSKLGVDAGTFAWFSHRDLPVRAGSRDWSRVPIFITGKRVRISPTSCHIEWSGVVLDKGERFGGIAPSATAVYQGSNVYLCTQHQYTLPEASNYNPNLPPADTTAFQVGYKCQTMPRNCHLTSSEIRTITDISGNYITFDGSFSGFVAGDIIELSDYMDSETGSAIPQRDAFVYLSNRSPTSFPTGSEDRPFIYGGS